MGRYVTAEEFEGEGFLPETIVRYKSRGKWEHRVVWRQLLNHAMLIDDERQVSRIEYSRLTPVELSPIKPEMELQDIEDYAHGQMDKHELREKGNWLFGFDISDSRVGNCNYTTGVVTLTIGYCAVAKEETIKDTILHELAHALTPGAGHSDAWERKALEIGCKDTNTSCTRNWITGKRWLGTCNTCDWTWQRSKIPGNGGSKPFCGRCHIHIQWEDRIDTLAHYLHRWVTKNVALTYDHFSTSDKIKMAVEEYKKYGNMRMALEAVTLKSNPYNYTLLRRALDARN